MGYFWWKSILKLLPEFKSFASCSLGQGTFTLFWYDKWNNTPLLEQFPELYSFAINDLTSVHQVVNSASLEDLFPRPLTVQAFGQF